MYVASSARAVATSGLSIAGRPAKPDSVSTWVCAEGARCATVSVQIDPGQPRPGMRITGRPVPETSTANAFGSKTWTGLAGSAARGVAAGGVAGGAPPHAAMRRTTTTVSLFTRRTIRRLAPRASDALRLTHAERGLDTDHLRAAAVQRAGRRSDDHGDAPLRRAADRGARARCRQPVRDPVRPAARDGGANADAGRARDGAGEARRGAPQQRVRPRGGGRAHPRGSGRGAGPARAARAVPRSPPARRCGVRPDRGAAGSRDALARTGAAAAGRGAGARAARAGRGRVAARAPAAAVARLGARA